MASLPPPAWESAQLPPCARTRTHVSSPQTRTCRRICVCKLVAGPEGARQPGGGGGKHQQRGGFSPRIFLYPSSCVPWARIMCSKRMGGRAIAHGAPHPSPPGFTASASLRWTETSERADRCQVLGCIPPPRSWALGSHRGPRRPSAEPAATLLPAPGSVSLRLHLLCGQAEPPLSDEPAGRPWAGTFSTLVPEARGGAGDPRSSLTGAARTWAPAHKSPGHGGGMSRVLQLEACAPSSLRMVQPALLKPLVSF